MSVAARIIITIQKLSGLPADVSSAQVLARVLSRRERNVPRAPEAVTSVAKVSEGVATFEQEPKIEIFSPFPKEDALRCHISNGPESFAAIPLIRVTVLEKAGHLEKEFEVTTIKNKTPCGTMRISIDYTAPTLQLSEEEIVRRLRAAAAPGKTMSFSQAQSIFDSRDDGSPTPSEPAAKGDGEDDSKEAKKSKKSHSHRSKKTKSGDNPEGSGTSDASADAHTPPSEEQNMASITGVVSGARDIMLDQAPRTSNRESLRNAVESRSRKGSGSASKIAEKEKVRSFKGSLSDVPICVTPCEKLTFGLQSHQASLETDLKQPLTLENKSSKATCFRFLVHNGDHPKYTLSASPEAGKLKPGEKMEVVLTLVIHCTTNLRFGVQMAMWKGHLKDYDSASKESITLTGGVQSKLSTKLDSEEVEVFSPPIGSGAFGTVYRGKYRGFEVAVKVLKEQNQPDLIDAFKSEVEMAEALRHTSIVNFVGAVHFPGQLALVTEFCPFGDLNSALKKYPFPYPLKLKALLDASRAMDYLHQSGMIHRDLKTENLLVVSLEAMSQTVCKLADFGTARGLNSFAQQKSMMLTKGIGTPIFMAPEILAGSGSYTEAADLYSFGVMMCHVANNETPYSHDSRFKNPYDFVQNVIAGMRPLLRVEMPADYTKLMTMCWDTRPEKRPPFCDISDTLEDMFFAARGSLPSASFLQH